MEFDPMRWPIPLEHEPARRVSPEEFEWALVAGLGRAASSVVIQEDELRGSLLAASLHTPSIDPQVDPRDKWIASMIEGTKDPAFYVEPLLVAGVELEQYGHTRDSQHRVGIIEHFAQRGEFGCREWLRRNLIAGRLEYEWLQATGWKGIVDIAKTRGGRANSTLKQTTSFSTLTASLLRKDLKRPFAHYSSVKRRLMRTSKVF